MGIIIQQTTMIFVGRHCEHYHWITAILPLLNVLNPAEHWSESRANVSRPTIIILTHSKWLRWLGELIIWNNSFLDWCISAQPS